MADDLKVYEPETIEENPLPQEDTIPFGVTQSTANETYSPQTIKDQPLPTKRIAHETIGQTLNTRSKRILGVYEFTEKGAIQIGKYEAGVSGELKLSPDGILAKNSAGNYTFALDGTTGNATFAGEVQAGALISGSVSVGNSDIVIDGGARNMVFYENGIPVIVIGNA